MDIMLSDYLPFRELQKTNRNKPYNYFIEINNICKNDNHKITENIMLK